MATRSIIATTDNGTTYEGVYCHYDGYPSYRVPELAKIITRDGNAARERLIANDWECLAANTLGMDTPLPYPTSDEYRKAVAPEDLDHAILAVYQEKERYGGERREQVIPGYGIAVQGLPVLFTGTLPYLDCQDWIEWAYVIGEDLTVTVYEMAGPASKGVERERFTVEDLAAIAAGDPGTVERIQRAECGAEYERCSHYAWAHDKAVPDESKRLSMAQWLGLEPIPWDKAIAGTYKGQRYEFGGGCSRQDGKVSLYVKGTSTPVVVSRTDKNGVQRRVPGMVLTLPPTKADMLVGASK